MTKSFTKLILTAVAVLSIGNYAQAAPSAAKVFKPESGGYRLTVPTAAQEIYRTTTGIRFVVGKNQLVSADIYSLPSFIAVPIKQYSQEQKKELSSFINKAQDFPDFKFEPQAPLPAQPSTLTGSQNGKTVKNSTLKERLQAIQAAEMAKNSTSKTPAKTVNKKPTTPKITSSDLTINYDNSASFAMNAPQKLAINRKYVVGKAYQIRNDKLLLVTVASPENEKGIAQAGLSAVTQDLKLSKPHYPEENLLTSNLLGISIDLPAGWHAFTLKADNIIMARTLSGVHNDNAMLRAFKTTEFATLAKADSKQLAAAEKGFIEKITKFTPNISIVKHEPIVIDGMNGSLIQSTDSDDLKKVFILNTYLFTPDGVGYQIRFSTDDTINYDLKLQAFTAAIKSIKQSKKLDTVKNTGK